MTMKDASKLDVNFVCVAYNPGKAVRIDSATAAWRIAQATGRGTVFNLSPRDMNNLALLADGRVMAWGWNYNGQMGDAVGNQSGCYCIEQPVQIPGVSGAMAISTGEGHAAALLGDGTLRIWGENHEGQVGNGTTVDEAPPVGVGQPRHVGAAMVQVNGSVVPGAERGSKHA